jgi:hypothetical protein
MAVIHKYPLLVQDEQTIETENPFHILSLQVQNGVPCLWVVKNEDFKTKYVLKIKTLGTGQTFHNFNDNYIGTYQLDGFVWHVFSTVQISI